MKKTITFIICSFLLFGCNKIKDQTDLELTLLNQNIITYSKNSNKDSMNIIKYALKNNSDKTYFINNLTEREELSVKGIYNNGAVLRVYNNSIEEKYEIKRQQHDYLDSEDCVYFLMDNFINSKSKLGYDIKYFGLYERNNIFFIHPNETIFFLYNLNLNRPTNSDEVRTGFVSLDYDKEYYSKLSIASDSSNYKRVLPKDILETIQVNNVKVYHGVIESQNIVPIKVLK